MSFSNSCFGFFPTSPHPPPPKEIRAHGISLNSQVPQDDIFAAFVAGVEKGRGKGGRKSGRSFPFPFVLPLKPGTC